MCSLKGGFVILRFFSIQFTMTGADGLLGTLNTDNRNSNGNDDGNTVKETGNEDNAVRSHRHRKLWAVNKQRENGKFNTSCEKSFFFFIFVSSLEGGQESPFPADD